MADRLFSIERQVYRNPEPQQVATLWKSHGGEAVAARWHWLDERTLAAMARTGRAQLGRGLPSTRRRSSTALQEAVAVEAAYVLGSRLAGERAAGMAKNGLRPICEQRGLTDVPVLGSEERGRRISLSAAARADDAEAAAAIDDIAAHEIAVGDVLRIVLQLVDEQPETGRYVLPAPGPAIAVLLADCQRAAVLAVYPQLEGGRLDPHAARPAPKKPKRKPKARRNPPSPARVRVVVVEASGEAGVAAAVALLGAALGQR